MHHGYQWLDKRDFILNGTVRSFFYGNPHIEIRVQSGNDLWMAETTDVLGAQLVNFTRESLKVGDTVTIYGYRSRDTNQKLMRADKVEVAGRVYVLLRKDIFGPPFGEDPPQR